MDTQKADMFLMTNAKYFEGHQVPMIRTQLLEAGDDQFLADNSELTVLSLVIQEWA
jgi:hypothetical protein